VAARRGLRLAVLLGLVAGKRSGGRHYHRVLFHRQLLGSEDWTMTVRCDHDH
jgi:hypothetical protein